MEIWKPKSLEDKLLYQYWSRSKGHLYLEVPIGNRKLGNWPPKSKVRRIDGVIVHNERELNESKVYMRSEYTISELFKQIRGKTVELIEVKRDLNRLVIGQIIAGVDMLERQYQTKEIIPVILCKVGDPALEWVCSKHNIEVHIM